jgi:hypothetical protein
VAVPRAAAASEEGDTVPTRALAAGARRSTPVTASTARRCRARTEGRRTRTKRRPRSRARHRARRGGARDRRGAYLACWALSRALFISWGRRFCLPRTTGTPGAGCRRTQHSGTPRATRVRPPGPWTRTPSRSADLIEHGGLASANDGGDGVGAHRAGAGAYGVEDRGPPGSGSGRLGTGSGLRLGNQFPSGGNWTGTTSGGGRGNWRPGREDDAEGHRRPCPGGTRGRRPGRRSRQNGWRGGLGRCGRRGVQAYSALRNAPGYSG